jgi:hypothetical protein
LLDGFVGKVSDITALDQLPDVFFDYKNVRVASTALPVRLEIAFSPWPLVMAAAAALTAILGVASAAFVGLRHRDYAVQIQGRTYHLRLRPFETRRIAHSDGGVTRVSGSLLGDPRVRVIPASLRK